MTDEMTETIDARICEAGGHQPRRVVENARVLANEEVAPGVFLIELASPHCARTIAPGQFVNLKIPGNDAEILRLPFSVYGTIPEVGAIEVLYQVVGQGTDRMTSLSIGDTCSVIGPLGNGWSITEPVDRVLMVSGGLGAAPLAMLASQLASSGSTLDILMGAPTAPRLVGRDRLERLGNVAVATDDGSEGFHGFVTGLVEMSLEQGGYDLVVVCGPEPMERIVCDLALAAGVRTLVSLEKLMACGIGACLSCVVDTVSGKKRVCADGPVFDAREVVW